MKTILLLVIMAGVTLANASTNKENFEYLDDRDLSGLDDHTRQVVEARIVQLKERYQAYQAARAGFHEVNEELNNKFAVLKIYGVAVFTACAALAVYSVKLHFDL